jgi:hypothetical protein
MTVYKMHFNTSLKWVPVLTRGKIYFYKLFPPWMEKWTSQYNFEMAQPMKHYSQVVFQLEL